MRRWARRVWPILIALSFAAGGLRLAKQLGCSGREASEQTAATSTTTTARKEIRPVTALPARLFWLETDLELLDAHAEPPKRLPGAGDVILPRMQHKLEIPVADAIDYVGINACAACHRARVDEFSRTRHAHASATATATNVAGPYPRTVTTTVADLRWLVEGDAHERATTG
jgi:hypothetical protein